ncbi:MAG: universal stress protein [candidate division KSB1 bacterium]|nr:universal stress protein [candidate division KSB1 bacterium]
MSLDRDERKLVAFADPPRVLVVDDDQEFRRSVTKIFQKAGFRVSAATSASDADALLKQEKYSLIVLDLKMPGKSGVEFLHEIKAKTPASKVIMVTAFGDAITLRQALAAGAAAFLNKPVKRKELLESAKRALESLPPEKAVANKQKQRHGGSLATPDVEGGHQMIKLHRILFPTDFSHCANQALAHALYLAKQYKAELHLLHVHVLYEDDPHHPGHHFPDHQEIQARLQALAATQMASDVAAYGGNDLKITQAQRRGISTAPAILEYAQEHDIDLIVMGTHGRRGLGHLLLGSVAEETVRLATCPVLTIRERKEPMPIETIRRILVPTDFSEHARQALRTAKEIAVSYHASLQLLHVIEPVHYPAFYMAEKISYLDIVPDITAKASQALQKLIEQEVGTEVEAERHVMPGRAAYDIVEFAKREASDLIVIATHGLTGLEHLLLGSVAEKVIRRAPCPVLTLKAFGKSLI